MEWNLNFLRLLILTNGKIFKVRWQIYLRLGWYNLTSFMFIHLRMQRMEIRHIMLRLEIFLLRRINGL